MVERCNIKGDNMRRIDVLRILALSAALILALGGNCGTSEEDASDTGKPPGRDTGEPLGVEEASPPVASGKYVDPFAGAPGEFVEQPYPGVDWDALGPLDTQMQPVGETIE